MPLPLSPTAASAPVSVLLRKLESQCSRAAVFTRDSSLKEESLFVLLIGLCLKTQKQVGSWSFTDVEVGCFDKERLKQPTCLVKLQENRALEGSWFVRELRVALPGVVPSP